MRCDRTFLRRQILIHALGLLALLGTVEGGQSGRKQRKVPPQPPVQGVNQPETRVIPEPEAGAEQKAESKKEKPLILIASSIPDIGGPSYFTSLARQACVSELRQSRAIDVQEAQDFNRVDAINAAKAGDRGYVVYLEFTLDRMGGVTSSQRWDPDLRYTIFEPQTAKVLGSGAGYPTRPSTSSPSPPIGMRYEDRLIEWMGRDAARKIRSQLKLDY